MTPLIVPRAVAPGEDGGVAIVAPSGPFDVEAFRRGLARLEAEGLRCTFDEGIFSRDGYFAGDDARRLGELRRALLDETVGAIIAVRGGYGATRLLDELDPAEVRANPKWLVGFSDVTALHALWARAGVASLHGPMVAALGDGTKSTERCAANLARALAERGGDGVVGQRLMPIAPGRAEGRLIGGNLAVLTALAGTPYEPPLDGAILVLEDIGERPYRVDRMLTTLRHAGWFGRVSGIALGAFTEAAQGADGVSSDDVLRERLGRYGFPVAMGLPMGHVRDNKPLPLGRRAVLDVGAGTLRLLAAEPRRLGESA